MLPVALPLAARLSAFMFINAILANVLYGLAIFLRLKNWDDFMSKVGSSTFLSLGRRAVIARLHLCGNAETHYFQICMLRIMIYLECLGGNEQDQMVILAAAAYPVCSAPVL